MLAPQKTIPHRAAKDAAAPRPASAPGASVRRKVNPPLTPQQEQERRAANAAVWKKIRREYDEAFRILAKM